MNYTKLKDLKNLTDGDIIEAVAGTISFVADPETSPSKSTGKPVTKQCINLQSSDGESVYCDIYTESQFMDRAKKGSKVIIASTVKDGKMQGVNLSIWQSKVRLRLFGGTNITFVDAAATTAPTTQPQQQQPQYQQKQQQQPIGLAALAALWSECYHAVLPICGEASAVQATATLFIEANKKGITATITSPAAAIKAMQPDARKLADAVLERGGYDYDKLPSGEELDAVVDLLIDRASESLSREAIGMAFDRFVSGSSRSRDEAVRMLVSDWNVFLGGVK